MNAYGGLFFMRPISLAIILLAVACIFWPSRKRVTRLWRRA